MENTFNSLTGIPTALALSSYEKQKQKWIYYGLKWQIETQSASRYFCKLTAVILSVKVMNGQAYWSCDRLRILPGNKYIYLKNGNKENQWYNKECKDLTQNEKYLIEKMRGNLVVKFKPCNASSGSELIYKIIQLQILH